MKKFVCCILILNLMFFSGCVEKSVQGNKSEEVRSHIVYNLGKAPDDLIMLKNHDSREEDLLVNLFEGLVSTDEKGKISPAIAESWTLSKDETCYTFKIRENAKWSDGNDITAEDFATFFSQILNKDIDNKYAQQLYYIFGAQDYRKGSCEFNNVAVRATDKKTLEIRLNYPCNYFLNILSEPIYSLRKIDDNLKGWKKSYKDIAYTGSFTIDNVSDNSEITLKKNSQYWNKDSTKSDEILITCIDGSEAALAAFENSKSDLFVNPPISEFKGLNESGKILEVSSQSSGTLVFNLKKAGIVQDANFRKALSIGIDRSNIASEILNDTVKVATAYMPPNVSDGMNGHFINKTFFVKNMEKEKAQDLIKKSKYNENRVNLKLIYLDTVENKKICEGIAKSLSENLNIKLECEGFGVGEFAEQIKENDYDIAKIDSDSSYDYPLPFLERWMSLADGNFYGYKNMQFDEKVVRARMEKDKFKKIELLKDAENMLMDDMPVIPLYFKEFIVCKKNNIEDVYITKKGNIKLNRAYIKIEP